MKLKLTLVSILLGCVSSVHADLIDLTPGGFNTGNGLPPPFFELQHQTFFDEAAHGWFDLPEGRTYLNGWVSRFGRINGGTYFFTNLFELGDTPTASISWNMAGQQDGFFMTMIDVFGIAEDGTTWENIYRVRGSELFASIGDEIVTGHGLVTIMGISFYGRNANIPDTGTTLLLFGLALAVMIRCKRYLI